MTVMYQSINPFRTVSYVWGALRRHFPEDVVTSIKANTMTKDERGAVFDVPEEHIQLFKDYIEVRARERRDG